MTRKPLSTEAKEAVKEVIRKFCEDVERPRMRRLPVHPRTYPDHAADDAAVTPAGVLAQLHEQPREA